MIANPTLVTVAPYLSFYTLLKGSYRKPRSVRGVSGTVIIIMARQTTQIQLHRISATANQNEVRRNKEKRAINTGMASNTRRF